MGRGNACISGLALALAVGAASGHAVLAQIHHYRPQVLFSLPYGKGESQVGIHPAAGDERSGEPGSLAGLRVPSGDAIYIGDQVQHRIKRLDVAGRVLAVADSCYHERESQVEAETLGRFGRIHDFAVTPQGRIFAAINARTNKVEVYDNGGAPQRQAWQSLARQVRVGVPSRSSDADIFNVDVDQAGFLYLHVAGVENEHNLALAKFDKDLRFVGVRPGFMVGWDGRTYAFVPNREPEPNDQLLVYSASGTLERTLTLRPPADVSAGDYDSGLHTWRAASGVLFDGRGDIYMVYERRRPREDWTTLMADFTIVEDIVVYKFDSLGKFVGKMMFDGLPFNMYPPVAVDPAGNIYHLRYYPDRVEFIKETLTVGAATQER